MLKFLVSHCTLNDKKVSYDYNLPFAYFVNFDFCQEKYPVLADIRTFNIDKLLIYSIREIHT